jgi:hypothetical protein
MTGVEAISAAARLWSEPHRSGPGYANYHRAMPRIWIGTMVILVACLIASMVIAIVKLA